MGTAYCSDCEAVSKITETRPVYPTGDGYAHDATLECGHVRTVVRPSKELVVLLAP